MNRGYINREAVRNELYEADAITMKGVEILNNFPAADVVEVVRCKDCAYGKPYEDIGIACRMINYPALTVLEKDYFCADGKRKKWSGENE